MIATVLILAAAVHVSARPLDACQVLTKRDLAAVQGHAYTSAKLTTHGSATTCFYQLPSFADSVSVDVTREGAKEYWKEHFGSEAAEQEHEPEERSTPPREVEGVGDDAVWVGSRAAGSLYVRKGDTLLRVSVGGRATDADKIGRSKKLAARALTRM